MQRTNSTQFYWQREKFVRNTKSFFSLVVVFNIPLRQSICSILLQPFCFSTNRIFAFYFLSFCLLFIFERTRHIELCIVWHFCWQFIKCENFLTVSGRKFFVAFYFTLFAFLLQSSIKYEIFAFKFVDSLKSMEIQTFRECNMQKAFFYPCFSLQKMFISKFAFFL